MQREKAQEWQEKYFRFLKETNVDEGVVRQKIDLLGNFIERV